MAVLWVQEKSVNVLHLSSYRSGNTRSRYSFFLIHSPKLPLILGFPWLTLHNPHIDWSRGVVRTWGMNCHVSDNTFCHSSKLLETFQRPSVDISRWRSASFSETQSTEVLAIPEMESVTTKSLVHCPELSRVPQEYADLQKVFSKAQVAKLPPHRSYDCTIELVPGTCPPRGRLYSLSGPERLAMDKYLKEVLDNGLICPSTSPAGAGFFLLKRRMGVSDPV